MVGGCICAVLCMCRGKRKRRSKVAIESKVVSTSKPVSDIQQVQTSCVVTVESMPDIISIIQSTPLKDRIITKVMDIPAETMTSVISGFDESFITNRLSDSKLPPLRGTVQEKQSLYNQKSKPAYLRVSSSLARCDELTY